MGGFNPAWFIAAALGVALLATDILIPEESRKKIGWALLSLGILLFIIGVVGFGVDVYISLWKKAETIVLPNTPRVEAPQHSIVKDKTAQPSGHAHPSARVDWRDKQNWRRFLHTGMTRTEVRRLFGDPEKMSVSGNTEFWNYDQGMISFDMDLHSDGSLYSWDEP